MVSRKQTKPPKPSVAAAAPPKAQRKPRSKLAGVERNRVLSGEVKGPSVRARVAKNVARIRRELKLSLSEMEERTGIHRGFIGAIEGGNQNITVDTLSNLAVAYGVPPDDLIRDRDTFTVSADTPSLAMLASITRRSTNGCIVCWRKAGTLRSDGRSSRPSRARFTRRCPASSGSVKSNGPGWRGGNPNHPVLTDSSDPPAHLSPRRAPCSGGYLDGDFAALGTQQHLTACWKSRDITCQILRW